MKEQLKRARMAHPKNGEAQDVPLSEVIEKEIGEIEETYEVIGDRVMPGEADTMTHTAQALASLETVDLTPAQGRNLGKKSKKMRAQFGRMRTHNEQILVAPCGIIIARETFYFSEAIPSVVVSTFLYEFNHLSPCSYLQEMIKRTYHGGFMPNHIIFDNNCTVAKHVKDDPDFANVGLAVDVFHFENKHADSDLFCQENCDPKKFPELRGTDGKAWFFNTSIAEQTNVWLGGFHSICREMAVDKYEFFLDEMITMRNRRTKEKLEKDGKAPRMWV